MKDVAQEAGVALGTVSKVFNGIPVGDSYRQRVEAAAQKLGYHVNSYARGLKANKTDTIALIIPSIKHPYFALLADDIIEVLMKRSYKVMMTITNYDPEAEKRCIQMLRQNKVDGIIALTYNQESEQIVSDDLPFISVDRFFNPKIPCITSDNFGGGQLAAEKLLELGCQKLLFLRIGSDIPGEPDKRGAGFENFCQMKQVEYQTVKSFDYDQYTPIYNFLEEHTADGHFEYDGIFCCTDLLAHKVIRKLESLNVRIPEDVQIIGFDGLRHFQTEELYCSSIVQPIRQIAETCVNTLLSENRSQLPALTCLPVSYLKGPTTRD